MAAGFKMPPPEIINFMAIKNLRGGGYGGTWIRFSDPVVPGTAPNLGEFHRIQGGLGFVLGRRVRSRKHLPDLGTKLGRRPDPIFGLHFCLPFAKILLKFSWNWSRM